MSQFNLVSLISVVCIVAGLGLAYMFIARPFLRHQAALAPFWKTIDAYELGFWGRICKRFEGLKTKLTTWFVMLAGTLVSLHDLILPWLLKVDVTPLTSQVPPALYPVLLIVLGIIFRWLRKVTNGPEAA